MSPSGDLITPVLVRVGPPPVAVHPERSGAMRRQRRPCAWQDTPRPRQPTLEMDELASLGPLYCIRGLMLRMLGYRSSFEGFERKLPLPWELPGFSARIRHFLYQVTACLLVGTALGWVWFVLSCAG